MRTLAAWCVHHRRIVVLLWVVVLVVSIFSVSAAGTDYSNNFSFPHTQSFDAINLLKSVAPSHSGDQEQVVFGTSGGAKLTDTDVGQRINTMVDKINKLPNVTQVTSPYDQDGNLVDPTGPNISKDQTVGFFQVNFDKQTQNISNAEAKNFVNAITKTSGDGLTVAVTGPLAEQANNQSFSSTGLGVLLALIVLLLVFGSIFAAILPILSALLALGTAIGVIGLMSHVLGMPSISPELTLLIGLGVGVDYALFIVTRHRQGLVAGRDVESSIINAVNTSGRAVLFAGIIVCIALLGMFALGVSFLYGLAVAAAIGVALTMVAALTLLPAMLGFIGPKVMSRKQKRNLAENGPRIVGADSKGFWPNWADRVQRYPWLSAGVALVIIVAIALPFFSLQLGSADQGTDPAGTPTRVAFDMLSKGFGPGFTGPLELVTVVPQNPDPALEKVVDAVAKQPGVVRDTPPTTQYIPNKTGDGYVALTTVYPTTAPQDAATTDLVNHLRDTTVPQAVGDSGLKVLVAGTTAIYIDFANVLSSKLPLFIGLVVILSFLLLMTVFRSLVIPLTAAIMNLLSIGAALGILVAVFQWGGRGLTDRPARDQPGRGLPSRDAVRHPLRVVDGLSGLPGLTHARGIHQVGWRQPHRRAQRTRRHRQDHHGGCADHDPRLRLVHPRRQPGHQGVRHRAGRRHCGGRRPHSYGHRALHHDDVREGQLVVPRVARPDPAQVVRRRGRPGHQSYARGSRV